MVEVKSNRRMKRVMVLAFLFLVLAPTFAHAQAPSEQAANRLNADEILATAERHLLRGEACLQQGNNDCARREFDAAMDTVLNAGLDVRADARLRAGYRGLIEKINRFEMMPNAASATGLWRTQDYEGRPAKETAEIANSEAGYLTDGPLSSAEFQARFVELRKTFREKYKREITLTGADHGEHRRLYGRGSAYDIRTRDLTREQVQFIISTGKKFGLRIKDFSTWDKVTAHNTRSLMLGRPLDTYATGVHLHIDRMAPPRPSAVTTRAAASSKLRKAEGAKNN
jgi:hypothetical protein